MIFRRSMFLLALCAASGYASAQQPGAEQLTKLRRPADKSLHESPGLELLNQVLNGRTITMDNAIQIALAINIPLAEANADLYIAEGRTQEAYSALNPTIGTILTGLRWNEEQTTTSLVTADPATLTSPIGKRVATQNIQQTLVALGASLPLDISGALNASGEQQKYRRVQAQYGVSQTKNDVVTNVKTAFYAVLRARALRTVAEDNLKNAQVRYTDAQNKYAAQVVTKFDVLRAQVDVANAEQQLISARNEVESLYASLNRTIGIKVNTRLHAVETGAVKEPTPATPIAGMPAAVPPPSKTQPVAPSTLPNPATPSAPTPNPPAGASVVQKPSTAMMPTPINQSWTDVPQATLGPDFDGDLKEALQNRPEIGEAKAGISSSQWGVKYAERSELPSADVGWDYVYAPNAPGLHPYTHTWLLSAQLAVPIFDGGLAAARIKEARGLVANSTSLLRDTQDQVTLEVEQALFAVQDARDRVRVANQTLAEAQEAFAIAQRRYNASVSPLIELSDAQDALTQAESNQVNALYDYNTAEAELDRALGRYSNYQPQPAK